MTHLRGAQCSQRLFDLTAASLGLACYAPFFATAAVAILWEDGAPVFFLQRRLGRQRRPFVVIKFRTMRQGRTTRVGQVLRATGLDETAQFLNVLTGSMRLVGPRPLTEADVQRLGWDRAVFDWRFAAQPGITGLAQLFGTQGARHSLRLDRLYLRRSSVFLNVQLVGLSFAANLMGKVRLRRVFRVFQRALRWTAAIRFPTPGVVHEPVACSVHLH